MGTSILWHHIFISWPDRRGYFDPGCLEYLTGDSLQCGSEVIPVLALAHFNFGQSQQIADDQLMAIRPMILGIAELPQALPALALKVDTGRIKEGQRQLGEQISAAAEQRFFYRILMVTQPAHRPVEVMQPQRLGAGKPQAAKDQVRANVLEGPGFQTPLAIPIDHLNLGGKSAQGFQQGINAAPGSQTVHSSQGRQDALHGAFALTVIFDNSLPLTRTNMRRLLS